eukprot:263118-Rhodomonas_salina.5
MVLCACSGYAVSGTCISCGGMVLRGRYAISRTGVPHSAITPRACYAMSGTDLRGLLLPGPAYAIAITTQPAGTTGTTASPIVLRACYALPGTDIA